MAETDREIEGLFAEARRGRDGLPGPLAARIEADALRVQAGWRQMPQRRGIWDQLTALLGGWQGLGGLATAGMAGIWIGLAPPDFLPDPVGLIVATPAEADPFGDGGLAAIFEEGN